MENQEKLDKLHNKKCPYYKEKEKPCFSEKHDIISVCYVCDIPHVYMACIECGRHWNYFLK